RVERAMTMEEIFRECDYITIHVPLTEETKGILNKDSFALMKENVHILNFSRGELVNEDDLEVALKEKKIKTYITDFPTDRILQMEGAIALPHLGASTVEAEENCAIMAAKEIREFLETGNIRNSVNFPNTTMPYIGKKRLTVIHKNIPNMVGQMTGLLANHQINIENMTNRSKGHWDYTMIDVDNGIPEDVVRTIEENVLNINGVKRVRIID